MALKHEGSRANSLHSSTGFASENSCLLNAAPPLKNGPLGKVCAVAMTTMEGRHVCIKQLIVM